MIARTFITALVATIALGCGHTHPFARGGYQHEHYPVYVAQTEGRIVSNDWIVEGWTLDDNEQPTDRTWGSRNDLALRHRNNAGRMTLDVMKVELSARDQALRVIDQEIIANGRGGQFGAVANRIELVSSADISLSGHAAHMVLVQGGDGAGTARGIFVFARANVVERRTRKWRVVPIMVVVGYVNSAIDFEAGLPDFRRFLTSIELQPSVSGETPATPITPADPSAPAAPTAPATTADPGAATPAPTNEETADALAPPSQATP